MPRATPTLLPVCDLYQWCPRQGSEDPAEETVTQARRKVGETLLRSLRICQCANEHCHRRSHPSLSPRISHSDEQNVHSPCSAVRGQSRSRTFPTLGPAKQHCPLLHTRQAPTPTSPRRHCHCLRSKTRNLFEPPQAQTGTSPRDVSTPYCPLN